MGDKSNRDYFKELDSGVIAQEIEDVVPEVVGINHLGYKDVDYHKLNVVLIGALQEQIQHVNELKQRINNLKNENLNASIN